MSLSPWLKSPFTDLTGAIVSHQWYGACADMEMKALDCLEAYGLDRGLKKCDPLIRDFTECALKIKQFKRMNAIRWERNRQYWAGERSKEDRWSKSPTHDSY
ncbi:NADH dehydrogenase [ubiquinone] iron-sulfur protein 5 [Anoplophora glabripennis]|uniref:NADH dehydrogenase [ubiquinone] iron-sulfur protein 5 n=1 Tax=Anoplophora glabripennis TaxID=217634 RepID=UPI0008753FBD|nr:NADH dehydrogenase [ubiquinone] iron-sulfur protein 5 [Anoplophora glabripennis]